MTLLVVGGVELGRAADVLRDQGWSVFSGLPQGLLDPQANLAVVRFGPLAGFLAEADGRRLRYQLVHLGPDDGEEEGSFARAHWRIEVEDLADVAERLKSRERMLVNLVAFGFKHGIPPRANWVFDARFLDNPYWVPELKPLTGLDGSVRDYVLNHAAATTFLDNAEHLLEGVIPGLREQGANEVTIAIGCTGGRHRSVALACELERRLKRSSNLEVALTLRDLTTGP